MMKRNFVALMLAAVAALTLSDGVRAGQPFSGSDGCAALAELVYLEVTAAAWSMPDMDATHAVNTLQTDFRVCNQTAQTVSQAFTRAMASIGSPVRWGYPSIGPGDTCLSHYLDQCYPDRSRLDGAGTAWMAVRRIVSQAMPNGIETDQIIFDSTAIRRALRSALDEQSTDSNNLRVAPQQQYGKEATQRR